MLTRKCGQGITLLAADGRELARFTITRIAGARVTVAAAMPANVSAARSEVAGNWKPRPFAGDAIAPDGGKA